MGSTRLNAIAILLLLTSLILLAGCSSSEPTLDIQATGAAKVKAVLTPVQGILLERVFPKLDFQRLTNLAQPDDGQSHIFVTEQPGQIHVFPDDQETTHTEIFLDIQDRVSKSSNEEGLLGLAFDTKYSTNGFFYVYYSASSPRRSVLSRFSVNESDPNTADLSSETIILEVPQPYKNHNGGQIAFGPDGYLYISFGDGGSAGEG